MIIANLIRIVISYFADNMKNHDKLFELLNNLLKFTESSCANDSARNNGL